MQPDPVTNASTQGSEPQPLIELLGRLSNDLQVLVRQEVALATREMEKKLDHAKVYAAALGLGLVLLTSGGLVLLASAVLGLALVLPAWAAALIVGGTLTLVGVGLVYAGKSKLAKFELLPKKTIANVERDVAAVRGAAT